MSKRPAILPPEARNPRDSELTRRCKCGAIIELSQTICETCRWKDHLEKRAERTLENMSAYYRAIPKNRLAAVTS